MAGALWTRSAIAWIVFASLFFYAWWNPIYLFLLVGSMLVNFLLGRLIRRREGRGERLFLLALGVSANLLAIAYFKYALFLVENANAIIGTALPIGPIVLPLAISFFTFQQITFLVDSYRNEAREDSLLNYALFVCFFPQLIAGPIVHHSEMLPQFRHRERFRPQSENLAVGATIFAVGLFKKAVLADGIAVHATPVFAAADAGATLDLFAAWGGALAYTFQLYFDFSGYSDMAIGAARMFGIRLPLNFNSPYKATSIIDFWRRWHITLSRFLRDYLYIPLGGSRHGAPRWAFSLMLTMLLGGLWHGAGWTFVVWGGLHGLYLVANHAWRWLAPASLSRWSGYRPACWLVTFIAVVVGWVFFRAATFEGALAMLAGMAALNGAVLPAAFEFRLGPFADLLEGLGVEFAFVGGRQFVVGYLWIVALFLIAVGLPNTQQWLRHYGPALDAPRAELAAAGLVWRPSALWAAFTAILLTAGILALPQVSEFLYFQF